MFIYMIIITHTLSAFWLSVTQANWFAITFIIMLWWSWDLGIFLKFHDWSSYLFFKSQLSRRGKDLKDSIQREKCLWQLKRTRHTHNSVSIELSYYWHTLKSNTRSSCSPESRSVCAIFSFVMHKFKSMWSTLGLNL